MTTRTQTVNPSPRTFSTSVLIGVAVVVVAVVLAAICDRRSRLVSLGFMSLALYTASILYVARKRMFLSRYGTLHAWMAGHIVMGAALLVTAVLHAGFDHVGTQGWMLYGLLVAEVGSGAWGFYELKATPRRFAQFAHDDFMYPTAVRRRISVLGDGIAMILERRGDELRAWYEEHYRAVLSGSTRVVPACDGFPAKHKRHATELHEKLGQVTHLRRLQEKIDEVDRRSRRWLWLHVPVSVALTTLICLHVVAWLYYR